MSYTSVKTSLCAIFDKAWSRDFLLFIPAGTPNLRAVLSYYASTATVNPEGDVHINESLQGFGNYNHFRTTYLYETLISTYICSSSTLLAMALLTVLSSPPILQESLDPEEEEHGISHVFCRYGNYQIRSTSVPCTISDSVASSRLASPFSTAH